MHRRGNIIPFPFHDPRVSTHPFHNVLMQPNLEDENFLTITASRSLFHFELLTVCSIFTTSSVTLRWRQSQASSISLPALPTCWWLCMRLCCCLAFMACNSQQRCQSKLTDSTLWWWFYSANNSKKRWPKNRNLRRKSLGRSKMIWLCSKFFLLSKTFYNELSKSRHKKIKQGIKKLKENKS